MGKARLSRTPNQRTVEQSQVSKFCIDLEGMMLPDAIAAVVEAWCEAQDIDGADELPGNAQSATDYAACSFYKSINFHGLNYDGSPWERLLRESTFYGCDQEWSMGPRWDGQRFRPRLTHVDERGKSKWVLLPFEWAVINANDICNYASDIVEWVEMENKTLANAHKRVFAFYFSPSNSSAF
jgi:hypothetical protein